MELEKLSGVELGSMAKRGDVAPTEVIDYFFNRIEKRNPGLNAFVYTKYDDAIKEAKVLETLLAKHEEVGPLAGVPIGLKDFLPSKKGWTNSHGGVKSLIMEDPCDSVFCASARKAGAIAVGKTNAPAFGFRGTCDNKLYGPTRNPFNTKYNSGGSSGGTAAAVADGLITMGEGGDGGGSIRIPASWCNLYGFKASVGSVPSVCRPDGWTATHPYCTNGVLTRNVTDSATIMEYMCYYDSRDPLSLNHGFRKFTDLMKKDIKDWKIAYTPDYGIFPVEKEVEEIVEKAAYLFTEAGAKVERVPFRFNHGFNEYAELWCKSISIDTAIDMENWKKTGLDLVKDHRDELPKEFIYWNEQALKSGIMDYRYFNDLRTEILDAFEDVFDNYDLILSPVTICPPVLNAANGDTKGPEEVNGVKVEPLIGFCETFFSNFTGNPAASIPAGFTKEGLPVGLQIIGRKFRDEDVLAASYTYERINPWGYENLT
jgi:amidase/aspartyl-tRNA(Asn)/glutamyl-tRNA(Gln) amidotransferase subunit A